jgi:hypothetical protein
MQEVVELEVINLLFQEEQLSQLLIIQDKVFQ